MSRVARLLAALALTTPQQGRAQATNAAATEATNITIRGTQRREAPGALTVSAERAREGAGTQGDPAKALQSLPGVGHSSAAEGEPVLWGATPAESRVYVDGVELPQLFHGSGVRSVIPAATLESISAVPGAYAAEHGRALGGLVELTTRSPDTEAAHLRASVDLLDASVLGSAPLNRLGGAAQLALRYGYVARWLPPLIDAPLRGLYRVPSYWDAQAQVSARLGASSDMRIVALTSADSSQIQLNHADPTLRQTTEHAVRFGRLYLRYERWAEAAHSSMTPFVGWDDSLQGLQVGAQAARLNVTTLRYGLRARHDEQLARSVRWALGLDASGSLGQVTHTGSFFVPPREGSPYPLGTTPGASYASDHYRAHVLGVAAFVEASWQPAPELSVTPALRYEPTLIEASRLRPPSGGFPEAGTSRIEGAIEPRLAAEARLSSAVRLFAAAGRYHQPPALADLGARFGNPSLGLASATHVAFGEGVNLPTRTRVDVVAFYEKLQGLPSSSESAQPELGQSLVARGEGRAFGAQLFVRQAEVAGFSGWVSATLSRSERRDAGAPSRLSDYDTPLVLAFTAAQRLGAWRLGARARYASGAPRTPVVGAYFDLTAQRYQPLLGPTNSARLRDFFQLDLRLDRRFQLDDASALELYLDALNVTFRQNQEELAYSSDFRRVGSVTGLPTLAIVGVTLER